MSLLYRLGGAEEGGMSAIPQSAQIGEDGQAFKARTVPCASSVDAPALLNELEDERENLFGWFRAAPARSSYDMIDLVIRVLAKQPKPEKKRG